jgi:iron complex outermembrane receptor protein
MQVRQWRRALRAALVTSVVSGAALAAEDAVVVTATRFAQQALDAPPGLVVITQEQIRSGTANTLPEVLVQQGGLYARNLSGSPDLQLDLRGFGITSDQNTLVLLDGVRINSNDLDTTKLSAIPLNAVERIEIMPGSGSVLYGAGATGGTINIITRGPRSGERSAYGFVGAGSYNTTDVRVGGTAAGERLGLTLHAGQQASDNYRANNRLRQDSVLGDLRFAGGSTVIGLKFGSDWQRLRLPGERNEVQLQSDPRGTSKPQDFADRDGDMATLYARRDLGRAQIAADFAYRDQATETRNTTPFGFLFANIKYSTYAFSPRARVELEPLGMRSTLVLGADFNDSDYSRRTWVTYLPSGAPAGTNATTQSSRGFYAQYNAQATQSLKVSAGWRTQRVADGNDITFFGPFSTGSQTRQVDAWELSGRYAITEPLAVFARTGTSFRFATADDNAQTATGRLLEPQTARQTEGGVEWRSNATRMRAAVYHIDLDNEIYFSPTVIPFGANTNLSPTYRSGVELEAGTRASRFDISGRAAYQRARFRSGIYGGVDVSGKDIPLVPRVIASLQGGYIVAPGTRASATITHVGEQRYDNDQDNTFPQLMPAYSLVDVKLTREQSGWRFAAAINNVLDKQYYSYGIVNNFNCATPICAYPQAGRTLFVSAERELK